MFDFFDIGSIGLDDVALAGAALYEDDDFSAYSDIDIESLDRERFEGPSMQRKSRPNTKARKAMKNVDPMYRDVQKVAMSPMEAKVQRNIFRDSLDGLGGLNRKYNAAAAPFVSGAQDLAYKHIPGKAGGISQTAARMAGSPVFRNTMRYLPAVGAVGGVLGAADVLAGPDSLGNKAMDTAAMGIGGFLGMAGGPLGAAAGAGLGKMGSDSLQWLFGDKKSAEQRQMENALLNLQRGNY